MGIFFRKNESSTVFDIQLLLNVLKILPPDYSSLSKQVAGGLLKSRFLKTNVVRNYVGFAYSPGKSKYFENSKEKDYVLHGVEVFNTSKSDYKALDIYVASGLVAGYATPNASDFKPDIQRVRFSNIYRQYLQELNSKDLSKLFDEMELRLLNPSKIYEVELSGNIYYHIADLEDGDFIGMDKQKRVYTITHDPYAIVLLNESLSGFLSLR